MDINKISKALSIFLKKAQMGTERTKDEGVIKLQNAINDPSLPNTVVDTLYNNEALYNEFIQAVQKNNGAFEFDVAYDNGNLVFNFAKTPISAGLQSAVKNVILPQLPRINSQSRFTTNVSWKLM